MSRRMRRRRRRRVSSSSSNGGGGSGRMGMYRRVVQRDDADIATSGQRPRPAYVD